MAPLNYQECQALKNFLAEKSYKSYHSILQRSRSEILKQMAGTDLPMKLYRLQGRLRQLEDLFNLPVQLDEWIAEYEREHKAVNNKEKQHGR